MQIQLHLHWKEQLLHLHKKKTSKCDVNFLQRVLDDKKSEQNSSIKIKDGVGQPTIQQKCEKQHRKAVPLPN